MIGRQYVSRITLQRGALPDKGPGGPPIINSYGGRSLHEMSHGESCLALMMERFGGNGLQRMLDVLLDRSDKS